MKSCLVIISHTLRLDSRIFREALKENDSITVVYASPWYTNKKEKSIIEKGDQSFFKKSLNHFACDLKEKLSIPLYLLKNKDINEIIEKHTFQNVYYDMPLFGKNSWINFKSEVKVIDSAMYDPECTKMTAKSRWVDWSKNRSKNVVSSPKYFICKSKELDLPIKSLSKSDFLSFNIEIQEVTSRLNDVILLYHKTRNHKEGSTLLSKYLHHGIFDPAELVSSLLKILPDFLDKTHPVVPLLRQLAFREICIRKARIKGLSMENSISEWAESLLDNKSYQNLIIEKPGSFTKEQFLKAETGIQILDKEINRLKSEKWAPNRIRMWLSSQCYYGIGGGIESLKALIELFNMYSDDGQSPNNYVCCVEAMRLQYGKVMNYNTKRTFKLIEGLS